MMIGARGGGGGDPRLEIFASEAKEFFSSVRAILGEGDATEARSAKINVLLEGFLKSSPRIADLVGDALPLDDSGAPGFSGAVVWHLWFSPGLSYTLFMGGYYQSRCICGLGVCKRPTGAGSGGWEQAASRLVPNGPVHSYWQLNSTKPKSGRHGARGAGWQNKCFVLPGVWPARSSHAAGGRRCLKPFGAAAEAGSDARQQAQEVAEAVGAPAEGACAAAAACGG